MRSEQALRYGVSYARQVFTEFGYFNTALRIAEDTDFSQRLGVYMLPSWAPNVQTKHKNPLTAWSLAKDMFARGQRAARRHAPTDKDRDSLKHIKTIVERAQRGERVAMRIGQEALKLNEDDLARVKRFVALASFAYSLGVAKGESRFARAQKLLERAQNAAGKRSIDLLEAAVALDPENVWFRLQCADALYTQGLDAAEPHIHHAIALSAYRSSNVRKLTEWLVERKLYQHAFELADLVGYALPSEQEIHVKLANIAKTLGAEAEFATPASRCIARDSTGQASQS